MKLFHKKTQFKQLGIVEIVASENKLVAIVMGDANKDEYYKKINKYLKSEITLNTSNHIIELTIKELNLYLSHELTEFSVSVMPIGTEFQIAVQLELLKIPFSKIINYKKMAEQLNTKAYRAVGSANGANLIPIIIPCHRVIASNNKLGGFSCGLRYKTLLHNIEGISI